MSDNLTLREVQEHIRSFDHFPERQHVYFQKLIEEVGELAEVLRTGNRMVGDDIKGTIEEELVDVLYYVAAIANLHDIDLATCFEIKDRLNAVRYGRNVVAR